MRCELIRPSGNISIKNSTQLVLDFIDNDGKKKNQDLNISIDAENIELEILGVYKLADTQELRLNLVLNHHEKSIKSTTVLKGVLLDTAESHFLGTIKIPKSAQQADSSLDHNVLTIGGRTKNESQPILQIEANDVKVSHGSTTGQIDQNQMYYLQSRGLTKDQSQNLILKGFFTSILDKILDKDIKLKVASDLGIEI